MIGDPVMADTLPHWSDRLYYYDGDGLEFAYFIRPWGKEKDVSGFGNLRPEDRHDLLGIGKARKLRTSQGSC
jgi:hypothetical protein